MKGTILRRKGILTDKEAELRAQEQELLDRLAIALNRFGPDVASEDLERFQEAREQLAGLFLLVIAGEFNSGKSSFINALFGERILREGVTPTTDRINVLRYSNSPEEEVNAVDILDIGYPSELLREMNIVDTPGTNAIIRHHEQLTRNFIPRCDLVLFVTSADRPFTESERQFLEHIAQWGKKIVFIVNKIDILTSKKDVQEVLNYVATGAQQALAIKPEIFGVSSRQALEAKMNADDKVWDRSGFSDVEEYLLKTLDQQERVRLKLLNPLNVGLRLASVYKEEAFERLKTLSTDLASIQNIDNQLKAYHREMLSDFEPRLKAAQSLFHEMEVRGLQFFDEHIRLRNFGTLLRSEKFKNDFERQVIADTPRQVEEEIDRIIDWLVNRNLKLWQDIDRYIDRRSLSRHKEELIGEVGQSFHYNRQALFDSVARVSNDVIRSYDRQAEARAITAEVRDSFATTAITEAGAVGLGALLVIIAHTALADFTGILAAAAVAVAGFYIIPSKRKRLKKEFSARLQGLQAQLASTLTRQVNKEVSAASDRINEAVGPYRRFVLMQQEQLSEAQEELVAVESALLRLRSRIQA